MSDRPVDGTERHFSICFRGVRGSAPVSGPETAEFGGATMCHELTLGQKRIIVDAGSGIRRLGLEMVKEKGRECNILLSHLHLDHVIGLTAFAPFFAPDFLCWLHARHDPAYPTADALARLFNEPLFPVVLGALASPPRTVEFAAGGSLSVDGHTVETIALNHGIGATGYKFKHYGRSIVILTDHENSADTPDAELVAFCRDADLIVYDAMWDDEMDYAEHKGWGHSSWQAGAALVLASDAKRLACVHHAPEASDATLRTREKRLQQILPGSFFARQGQTIVLE